ncbi:hypothetical protein CXF68_12115 [Tenacibaculum sp. Bg11-29]|uniref:hypothetical protein n=1 Tax=Tenacibaculum sp. Bg11-29 TaxID=2058306 RepID=UPI000C33D8E9|nr:hypothetical protein [Tenacibaculum sp. Bg11-29]PKH51378.1 hypothetical protein CXF68_12115 [Tenacibaculum sp. Bg11-29]
MKTITNKFKIALVAVGLLTIGTVSAQRTTGADFTKQANTVLGAAAGSVKVVDNKGTIKYLQSNNGVTMFTDTAPDGGVVTTWQLGGTLTDNTYIDASGAEFGITGISAIDPTVDAAAAISDIAATTYGATGFTLMVRDEVTGEIKKLLATDLVSGIRTEYIQVGNAAADVAITVTGLPLLTVGSTFAKLFVYRNGVKLRTISDFVATADTVTIQFDAADLPMYAGDIIEIQYIK